MGAYGGASPSRASRGPQRLHREADEMQADRQESLPASERASPAPMPVYASPWRALAVGACGVALLCAITPYNDYHLHNTFLYGTHLPVGGLFVFAAMALAVNPLWRRLAPRRAFRPGELLLIWVDAHLRFRAGLVRTLAISGADGRRARLFHGFRASTGSKVSPQSPDWLLLTRDSKSALALWFYYGLPPGQPIPWAAWTRVVWPGASRSG